MKSDKQIAPFLIEFILYTDGQKQEWLKDLRNTNWSTVVLDAHWRGLFMGAKLANINRSVAHRLLAESMERQGVPFEPKQMCNAMFAAYGFPRTSDADED
jgi:hypothetical protein